VREAAAVLDLDVLYRPCPSGGGATSRHGKGQPLQSFALSYGEIPWFDVRGETQRCDWWAHTTKRVFQPITALYLPPYIRWRSFAKRQFEWQWL